MSEYIGCIRNPLESRRFLVNLLGQGIPRVAAMPREDENIADPRGQCQGRKQILIVLGNSAMAAECVGDKCQDTDTFFILLSLRPNHRPSAVTNGIAVPQAKERPHIGGMQYRLEAT